MTEKKENEQSMESKQFLKTRKNIPHFLSTLNRRKWVFPAIYVMTATAILTLMWVMRDVPINLNKEEVVTIQQTKQEEAENSTYDTEAIAVQTMPQTMRWPVDKDQDISIVVPFYDNTSANETRQSAIVQYRDMLTAHVGVDFKHKANKRFDVLAVLDGTVSRIEQNPVSGYRIEISHQNGMKSVYQSVSEIEVKKDQEVKQGQIIAKAGRNELEKEQEVHLHFEIRQQEDEKTINPETLIKK